MIFITGDTYGGRVEQLLKPLGIGRMFSIRPPRPYEGEPWGFDNGAYVNWKHGQPFDGDEYLRRINKVLDVPNPYLTVVPDLVAQGLHSLDFSLRWLDNLPKRLPWYLAVQDGMKLEDVESVIHRFSGLFLGGSDGFKATAWHWSQLAHRRGKKFHYGRCGTLRKLRHAIDIGTDSADSAFILWRADRFYQFVSELQTYKSNQLTLWELSTTP